MHAAVVYNPVKVPLERARRAVEQQQHLSGWDESCWYETSSEDSGRSAAKEALASDPSVIIVAGGDGTVRTVAEAVQRSGTPLALLPAGTGNLLARNLGLPLNDLEIGRCRFRGLDTDGQYRQFDVRFESPHAVEFDGDGFGLVPRARITVRPGALRVCIGANGG